MLKISIITIIAGILILIGISISKKLNPTPTKRWELEELGGHNYQTLTSISIAVIGLGIIGLIVSLITYLIS